MSEPEAINIQKNTELIGVLDRWIDYAAYHGMMDKAHEFWSVRDVLAMVRTAQQYTKNAIQIIEKIKQSENASGLYLHQSYTFAPVYAGSLSKKSLQAPFFCNLATKPSHTKCTGPESGAAATMCRNASLPTKCFRSG